MDWVSFVLGQIPILAMYVSSAGRNPKRFPPILTPCVAVQWKGVRHVRHEAAVHRQHPSLRGRQCHLLVLHRI